MNKTVKTYAKRCISALLGAALSVGLTIPALAAKTYVDVPGNHWAISNITYVTDMGLFIGTSDTEFSPERNLTRAMLTKVLYRYAGSPAVTGAVSYSDVSRSAYYANATIWAKENKIFDAEHLESSTLDPEGMMPRGEFCVMLKNFAVYKDKYNSAISENPGFNDYSELSKETVSAMIYWAYTRGIVKGYPDNTIRPNGLITRAEVAAMLERFDRNIMKEEYVPVDDFYLYKASGAGTVEDRTLVVNIGDKATLGATFLPENATTDKTLTWASSDPNVVEVDGNGNVTAKSVGVVEITAENRDQQKGYYSIWVVSDDILPDGIELNRTSVMLEADKNSRRPFALKASISPITVANKTVTWSTSNSAVANVNDSGVVTLKGLGTATITAKSVNGLTATCDVTIKTSDSFVKAQSIIIATNHDEYVVGKTATCFIDQIIPSNVTGYVKLEHWESGNLNAWISSNPSVATVDKDGKITFISPGKTTISISDFYGAKGSKEITVIS